MAEQTTTETVTSRGTPVCEVTLTPRVQSPGVCPTWDVIRTEDGRRMGCFTELDPHLFYADWAANGQEFSSRADALHWLWSEHADYDPSFLPR